MQFFSLFVVICSLQLFTAQLENGDGDRLDDFDVALEDLNKLLVARPSRERSAAPGERSGNGIDKIVKFVLYLNAKLNQTRIKVGAMDSQLDTAKSDIAETRTQVGKLDNELDTAKSDVAETQIQVGKIDKELDIAQTEIADTRTQIGKMDEKLDTAKSDIAATQNQVADTRTQVGKMDNELDTARSDIAETRIQVGNMDKELETAQSDIAVLMKQIDEVKIDPEEGSCGATSYWIGVGYNREPCKAFNASRIWGNWWHNGKNTRLPQTLYFKSKKKVRVTRFKLEGGKDYRYYPRQFTFFGSNDEDCLREDKWEYRRYFRTMSYQENRFEATTLDNNQEFRCYGIKITNSKYRVRNTWYTIVQLLELFTPGKYQYQCCTGEVLFWGLKKTVVFPVKFASTPALEYGFIKLVDRTKAWVTYSGLTRTKVDFSINDAKGALRIRYIACGNAYAA